MKRQIFIKMKQIIIGKILNKILKYLQTTLQELPKMINIKNNVCMQKTQLKNKTKTVICKKQ